MISSLSKQSRLKSIETRFKGIAKEKKELFFADERIEKILRIPSIINLA
jgi:hypothetical protein